MYGLLSSLRFSNLPAKIQGQVVTKKKQNQKNLVMRSLYILFENSGL